MFTNSKKQLAWIVLGTSLINLAGANLASAQALQTISHNGPNGTIGWSTSAPVCQKMDWSAPISTNFGGPSFVGFAPGASGSVVLMCNVNGISNGLNFSHINTLEFVFSNATAGFGCSVEIQLVDRTTLTTGVRWATDSMTVYSGVTTVNIGGFPALLPTHTYDLEFYVRRPPSAVNICNPVVYAAYLAHV